MPPPTIFGVVEEAELYVVREAVPGTIPASAGSPDPFTAFTPSDTPMLFEDESFQGSMGDFYASYTGPLISGWSKGGHIFGDLFGNDLYNILGDLAETGTAAAPAGTTNAAVAAGATALPVASGGASFTAGMYVWIEDAGTPALNEVVKVGSGSTGTSVVLATGTRFAHQSATPFTNTTAPYTHIFAVLNGSVGAWNGPAQPPTHCYTHLTGLPATTFARQYPYSCVSELTITANSEKLLDYTSKGVCLSSAPAGSPVTPANTSTVLAIPSWETTLGINGAASGGTKVPDFDEFTVTIGRHLKAQNTLQGSQAPYIIGRGKVAVSGKSSFMPAISEAPLLALLAGTQPQLEMLTTNGLSGASLVSLQVDIALAAYQKADIKSGDVFFGYDVPWKAPHNAVTALTGPPAGTVTGASGGKSAIKVTLINAVPSYAN